MEERTTKKEKTLNMKKGSLYRVLAMVFLLGIATAGLFMSFYSNLFAGKDKPSEEELAYFKELDAKYGKYYSIEKTVRENTLYDINENELDNAVSTAVLKMVNDAYSEYYTPEDFEKFERKYLESYSGIGVATKLNDDGEVEIARVIEGGPAEGIGIEAGDIIISIDGTKPESLDDASRLLGGDPGTKTEVGVRRGEKEIKFAVYRQEVVDKSVSSEPAFENDKIAYIKIATFREGTAKEVEDAVNSMKSKGYDKFIIDVRGNVGGVTDEGIETVDLFLPACKILTIKNHNGEEGVHNSDSGTLGVKYVVLVDGDTGSASEIFAGAIKDNKGGKVIGTKTFGKGVIQTLFKMSDGSVIKITTDEYILPSGESINEVGVEPDIKVGKGEDIMAIARKALLED